MESQYERKPKAFPSRFGWFVLSMILTMIFMASSFSDLLQSTVLLSSVLRIWRILLSFLSSELIDKF